LTVREAFCGSGFAGRRNAGARSTVTTNCQSNVNSLTGLDVGPES